MKEPSRRVAGHLILAATILALTALVVLVPISKPPTQAQFTSSSVPAGVDPIGALVEQTAR